VTERRLLDYKRVLIVDDEPDVLEILEELLPMCDVVKATTYQEARELLEREYFDIAVLDIMGVNGYQLLEAAIRRNVIAVMLTAHAMNPESILRSYQEGAAYFIPKDEITRLTTFLNDVLEAKEQGKPTWARWFRRFGSYLDKRFGPKWQEDEKEFWEEIKFHDV